MGFLSFPTHKQRGWGTHNPLVEGSSPSGPTIQKIHCVMALRPGDHGPLVCPVAAGGSMDVDLLWPPTPDRTGQDIGHQLGFSCSLINMKIAAHTLNQINGRLLTWVHHGTNQQKLDVARKQREQIQKGYTTASESVGHREWNAFMSKRRIDLWP